MVADLTQEHKEEASKNNWRIEIHWGGGRGVILRMGWCSEISKHSVQRLWHGLFNMQNIEVKTSKIIGRLSLFEISKGGSGGTQLLKGK